MSDDLTDESASGKSHVQGLRAPAPGPTVEDRVLAALFGGLAAGDNRDGWKLISLAEARERGQQTATKMVDYAAAEVESFDVFRDAVRSVFSRLGLKEPQVDDASPAARVTMDGDDLMKQELVLRAAAVRANARLARSGGWGQGHG